MSIKYSAFVDYEKLDPVKRMALDIFEPTFSYPERLGIKVIPETLGQTAVAFDLSGIGDSNFHLSHNIEGLGTKNLIAEKMYKEVFVEKGTIAEGLKIKKLFKNLGIDTAAMSVNDTVAIGADVFSYIDIIASGNSSYFSDMDKNRCLLQGYRQAADENGFAIPQGETPELPGIVFPETLDLAGSSIGLIRPTNRLITGSAIKEGDVIYGLASSGIHANGISKARSIASKSKDGFFTALNDGSSIGEKLLTPTKIYQRHVRDMQNEDVEIHYLQPITGHAWEKIARARKPFDYRINHIPETTSIFQDLINLGKEYNKKVSSSERFDFSNKEKYYTWNMGVGCVVVAPKESGEAVRECCKKYGTEVSELGSVEKGERRVIMPFKEGGQRIFYKP